MTTHYLINWYKKVGIRIAIPNNTPIDMISELVYDINSRALVH